MVRSRAVGRPWKRRRERDGGVKRGEGVIIDTGQAVTILQGPAKVKLPPIQLARTSGQ